MYTTKTMPVVYSTKDSPAEDLSKILKRCIYVLN